MQWLLGPDGDLAPFKELISNAADATLRYDQLSVEETNVHPETDAEILKMTWHVDG